MEDVTEKPKTTEELVSEYIALRTSIQELEERHEAEVKLLKDQQDAISDKLIAVCNELNADSIKTSAGTVSRSISTRYWVSDWENMYNFILENDAIHLLERRVHSSNMKQFLDENPDLMPIGLQADNRYVVRVRKPTTR
jgi:hypothetical protein